MITTINEYKSLDKLLNNIPNNEDDIIDDGKTISIEQICKSLLLKYDSNKSLYKIFTNELRNKINQLEIEIFWPTETLEIHTLVDIIIDNNKNIQHINISKEDIIFIQETLLISELQKYLINNDNILYKENPAIINYKNKNYLIDGNHKVIASIILNKKLTYDIIKL